MDKQRKREAVLAYKETKAAAGVFVVRCAATGEAWVGGSRNLSQQQNGLWFRLRLGSHPNPGLQAAWNAHGESGFSFEPLEELSDDDSLSDVALAQKLKGAEQRWRENLGAEKLTG